MQRVIRLTALFHGCGMSCNNAQLITQNLSEVVTHYTGYYTAKNRKKWGGGLQTLKFVFEMDMTPKIRVDMNFE